MYQYIEDSSIKPMVNIDGTERTIVPMPSKVEAIRKQAQLETDEDARMYTAVQVSVLVKGFPLAQLHVISICIRLPTKNLMPLLIVLPY
jgi:hypothetical protein